MSWVLTRLLGGKLLRAGGFDVTLRAYHGGGEIDTICEKAL